MDYYKKRQYVASVDKQDRVLGKIEKWKAHKEGLLHRAFSVVLLYNKSVVLQHRKHPAFDGLYDLTFSSHQLFDKNRLTSDVESIKDALRREWTVNLKDAKNLHYAGKFYYKAKDPHSIYTEHEIDYIYTLYIDRLPRPNLDYAYGFKLVPRDSLSSVIRYRPAEFCPWTVKIREYV